MLLLKRLIFFVALFSLVNSLVFWANGPIGLVCTTEREERRDDEGRVRYAVLTDECRSKAGGAYEVAPFVVFNSMLVSLVFGLAALPPEQRSKMFNGYTEKTS